MGEKYSRCNSLHQLYGELTDIALGENLHAKNKTFPEISEPFDSIDSKLKSLSFLLFTSAICCNTLKSVIFKPKGKSQILNY